MRCLSDSSEIASFISRLYCCRVLLTFYINASPFMIDIMMVVFIRLVEAGLRMRPISLMT